MKTINFIMTFLLVVLPLNLFAQSPDPLQNLRDEFEDVTLTVTEKMLENYRQEAGKNKAARDVKEAKAVKVKSDQAVTKMEEQISTEKRNVIQYKRDIPVYEKEIVENKKEITRNEELVPDLERELDRLNRDLTPDEDTLREKEFELRRKQEDVEDKQRDINRIQEKINDINRRIWDDVDSVREAENRLDDLARQADRKNSEIKQNNDGISPPCVSERLNNPGGPSRCDGSAFIVRKENQKRKNEEEIRDISNKLNDVNTPDPQKQKLREKRQKLEDENRQIDRAIQAVREIIPIFNHRDDDIIPIRDLHKEKDFLVEERDDLANAANDYERNVVEPIRQRVEQKRVKRDRKKRELDGVTSTISGLKARNRRLQEWIEFRERRIVELEGDGTNPGLIEKWEKVDLPQLKANAEQAGEAVVAKEQLLADALLAFDTSLAELRQLQNDQDNKRIELYEASIAQ